MTGPFDAEIDFGSWHCAGEGDRVTFTRRDTGETRELEMELYFGYFVPRGDSLYIASASRLYRLDRDCRLLWRSDLIAVDGVIVRDFSDTEVEVSCEMDPPGGWVTRRLSAATGKEHRIFD